MVIAVILGMGLPTTAAYAISASVLAPGLIKMGVEPWLRTSLFSISPVSLLSRLPWL